MSDSGVNYLNVGDDYIYPNKRTMGAINSLPLFHGAIYAIGSNANLQAPFVNYTYYKKFQYNPAEVQLSIQASNTDTAASQQSGGAAPQYQAVGGMSASFQLRFTRDSEVYVATRDGSAFNTHPDGGTSTRASISPAADIYRRIGVQKDIYDLFRVILAGDDAGVDKSALPADMTMSAFTAKAYDLASVGSTLISRPVFIMFNPDLCFFGYISSFDLVFNKFNRAMVPLWATVNLGLDITNVRPQNTGLATGTSANASDIKTWMAPASATTTAGTVVSGPGVTVGPASVTPIPGHDSTAPIDPNTGLPIR